MKHGVSVTLALVVSASLTLAAQGPSTTAALGHVESGASKLFGYLVSSRPCLPVKRFAADAGYQSNISPSRRSFAVIVGSKTSLVLDLKTASIDGTKFTLSVPAFERDGDFFVPLEFYEKAFPARFTFDSRKRSVTAVLPGRTLTIPIKALPARK